MTFNKKSIKILLALFIATASALYLYTNFNWDEIISRLGSLNILKLILCCFLYVIFVYMKALRWSVLVKNIAPELNVGRLYIPSSIISTLSMILPAQAAESLKIEVLRRNGIDFKVAFRFFVIERFIDLSVVMALFTISILVLDTEHLYANFRGIIVSVFILLTILGCLLILLHIKKKIQMVKTIISSPKIFFHSIILTIAAWALMAWAWQLALASTDIFISFLKVIALMVITMVSVIVSFIPGGLGVSEVVISEVLVMFEVDTITAQTSAIVMRITSLLWILIGVGHFLYWWFFSRKFAYR